MLIVVVWALGIGLLYVAVVHSGSATTVKDVTSLGLSCSDFSDGSDDGNTNRGSSSNGNSSNSSNSNTNGSSGTGQTEGNQGSM